MNNFFLKVVLLHICIGTGARFITSNHCKLVFGVCILFQYSSRQELYSILANTVMQREPIVAVEQPRPQFVLRECRATCSHFCIDVFYYKLTAVAQ